MVVCEEELLLENLQPHGNIRELILRCYGGMRIPSWAKEGNLATLLPNLVKIKLKRCNGLQHLPSMRRLCHLKSLKVVDLDELEYIEENRRSRGIMSDGAGASQSETFFPSLELLRLEDLPKLKGWWRDDEVIDSQGTRLLPSFPCLSYLTIESCPNWTCVPTCLTVERVVFDRGFKEKLRITTTIESANSKLSVRTSNANISNLRAAMDAFQCLQRLEIRNNQEMESLAEVEEVFHSYSSSLRNLEIRDCPKLKSVNGVLEHPTALEELKLTCLPNLNMRNAGEVEEDDGMPWHCLQRSLRSLKLEDFPKMVKLPQGMRYLTALEELRLENLPQLNLSNAGEAEDDGMPWHCLQRFRSLDIDNLPKMV